MSVVVLSRPVDVVFGVLKELLPMSDPASYSGNGEEDRVHISRETHGTVNEATVEVNVGVKFAADEVFV